MSRRGERLSKRRITRGAIRRHPWLAAVVLLVAALSAADRAGYLRGRRADRPVAAPIVGDMTKYHEQVFTVTNVADGDTLEVDVADGGAKTTRIRLWGVDTPEVAGPSREAMFFGPEASEYTKHAVLGKRVRLRLVPDQKTRDQYNRLLAYVVVEDGGAMLNELLLRSGHAYADPRFPHPLKTEFQALESQARRSAAGLWKQVTPEQLPRWKRERPAGRSGR